MASQATAVTLTSEGQAARTAGSRRSRSLGAGTWGPAYWPRPEKTRGSPEASTALRSPEKRSRARSGTAESRVRRTSEERTSRATDKVGTRPTAVAMIHSTTARATTLRAAPAALSTTWTPFHVIAERSRRPRSDASVWPTSAARRIAVASRRGPRNPGRSQPSKTRGSSSAAASAPMRKPPKDSSPATNPCRHPVQAKTTRAARTMASTMFT